MTGKRRYDDGCGVAHALNVLGERWALLIVRDLLLGPKRFTDLQVGLPGAGPNVLTQRLRDLQDFGVVRRRTLPPPAGSSVYELTEWGTELEPIVTSLGMWGSRSPVVPAVGEVGPDSAMLSFRSAFDPDLAGPVTMTAQFWLGPESFTVRVIDGRLVGVERGSFDARCDASVEIAPGALNDLVTGGATVAGIMQDGRLRLDGDVAAAERTLMACAGATARPAVD